MSKRKAAGPGAPSDVEAPRKLTWKEERFAEEYVRNNGNGTRAYLVAHPGVTIATAGVEAYKYLKKPQIIDAIEAERDRMRTALRFTREDALRILHSIATTTPDQVVSALRIPYDSESYVGLADKRYAIQVQKSPEGYSASTPTMGERRAALNDLWEKLGLGKEAGGRDRTAFVDSILALAGATRKPSESGK